MVLKEGRPFVRASFTQKYTKRKFLKKKKKKGLERGVVSSHGIFMKGSTISRLVSNIRNVCASSVCILAFCAFSF